ncbi:MAG: glycosyltransferase [Rubrivivax sp.]|nr:MAG: glycosyltransferase [Rubrivivax sp.]
MSPRLRPLHVGKFVPPPFAGMETHVDTLLRSIAVGADSTLVASEPLPRRAADPSVERAYRVRSIRTYAMLGSVPLSPGVLAAARQEIDSGRCNLMHVHAPNPWGDLAILRAPAQTPVVMTWHSDIVRQQQLLKFYGVVQQKALRRADRVIVFTPKHFESSSQLGAPELERKVVTVPIGIDFERLDATASNEESQAALRSWAAGRPILLSVGRHVYYKGYQHLIAALKGMRSEAVLVMIGAGPLSAELQRLAQELGVADRIRFMGEVDQSTLVGALRLCDVFCLPSIEQSEAFGIASAEAMAYGKPTVVCQLGNGVNYLNQEGRTSLVTPPRDEAALSDALDAIVRDDALRQRLGDAAATWVRSEFALSKMRDGTLALYRSLC